MPKAVPMAGRPLIFRAEVSFTPRKRKATRSFFVIERVLAYDIGLDERRPVNPLYIKRQVETHIGERLNVLLSKTRYELRNGVIFGQGNDDPFLDVLKRGRDYRRRNGREVDHPREDAEVIGFSKIQKSLGNPETPIGTMMLSISPPGKDGSIYKHNYYDVFFLKEDQDGRCIEARRYSSSLGCDEYAKFLNLPFVPDDSYLLSNPILVDTTLFGTPDDIHRFLHREHDYLSEEDFRIIIEVCRPFILAYIEALVNTNDRQLHALAFNAILNRADKARDYLEDIKSGKLVYPDKVTRFSIEQWGSLPVMEKMTGCGYSGGFSISKGEISSPFSVSEFTEWFTCPKCQYHADGPVGNKCPSCGITKEQFVKENRAQICA